MNAKKATMNVSRSRTLGVIVGCAALLLSVPAYALSLGGFQVDSALDEPLKAKIQLNSVDPATLESLEVTLGTKEDFQRADVPRSEFLQQLKFTVSKDGREPVVIVTSDKPIREPFLHFLISAQWSGGKLVREYTGLLDPPLYATGSPSPVESPAVGATSGEAAEPSSSGGAMTAGESSTSEAPSSSTGAMGSSGRSAEYGPTQKGDTLWEIASKLDTGSLKANVFQVMIALLRENPDAFIDNNINLLKTGQTLSLKDLSTVASISPEEASVAYAAQLEAWQTYRSSVAGAEVEAPAQEAGEGSTTAMASEQPESAGESSGASTAASASDQASAETSSGAKKAEQGQDVLRIVQATLDDSKQSSSENASAGSDRSGEIAELRGQIATLQESLESRNLENKDLRERVQMLESQVENAQRLVNIQDQELAAAQQQAAARQAEEQAGTSAQQVTSQPVEPAASQDEPAPVQAESQKQPEPAAAAASVTAQGDSAAKAEPTQPSAAAASESTAPQKAAPASSGDTAKVRKVSSRPPMASWWANITDMLFSSWMWMVGAGVGVLVLVLGLLMFLRRRQSIAEFEESILSGSALDSYSESTDTAGTSASDTSFLSDFGTAGMGTMQADEVDPLAEAEVYLAYGRDEQAEDVLKEAARRDPDRSEIKLKLLEIYRQRNDVKSFETIAEELYPAGDQGDVEVWKKVTAMGREVSPGNPLFDESGGAAPAPADVPAGASAARADAGDAMGVDLDEAAPPPSGGGAAPTVPRQPAIDNTNPNRAADEDREPAAPAPAATAAPARAQSDDNTLDFGDDFLEQTSRTVDPSMQPFPAPDQQTDLDRELDRLASEREVGAMDAASKAAGASGDDESPSRDVSWDKADADASTLDFPSSDNSEIEFDLNLDESSIQQLSGSDTRSAPQKASGDAEEEEGDSGESLMEFESENIPPEETWAGASTDATPGGEEDVSYSPSDDVQSAAAPQYNEAETKLDLARAYLDMGDKVGARSIIDEVMREGDPAQRDQAAELAAQL